MITKWGLTKTNIPGKHITPALMRATPCSDKV